jgi:predicted PurR-regulated permease PerM
MGPQPTRDRTVRLLVILANLALGLLLLLALAWLLLRIFHTVLVFCLGALVAYAMEPVVRGLRRLTRGAFSRGVSVFVALISVVGAITLLLAMAAGPTGRQVRDVEARAPELRARADALAVDADRWLAQRDIPFRVATGTQRLSQLAHDRSLDLARGALHAAGVFGAVVLDLLLVLLVAVYLLVTAPELRQRLVRRVPATHLDRFQALERDLNQLLGGYIRGQLVLATLIGVAAGLSCALLRLPFPILIGLFAAVTSVVPLIGAYLGAVPAVLLALLDPVHPAAKVGWIVALFIVINEIGSKVLYPRLVGHATGLHAVFALFLLLAGAEVGGILGALLAVPLAALAGLLILHTYRIWEADGRRSAPCPLPGDPRLPNG